MKKISFGEIVSASRHDASWTVHGQLPNSREYFVVSADLQEAYLAVACARGEVYSSPYAINSFKR